MDTSKDNSNLNAMPDMRPSSSRFWIKDSSGYPSVTITFLFVSFWITTLAYVLSIVSKIGPLEIRSFDVGACGAYFGIIFSAYIENNSEEVALGGKYDCSENNTSGIGFSVDVRYLLKKQPVEKKLINRSGKLIIESNNE